MTIHRVLPVFVTQIVVIQYKKYTLKTFPTSNSDSSDI